MSISFAETSTSPLEPSITCGPVEASPASELTDHTIPPMVAAGPTTSSSTRPMMSGSSPRRRGEAGTGAPLAGRGPGCGPEPVGPYPAGLYAAGPYPARPAPARPAAGGAAEDRRP